MMLQIKTTTSRRFLNKTNKANVPNAVKYAF